MRIFLRLFLFVLLIAFPGGSYAAMSDHPIAKLQALDKSTARTITFEAKVGSTIEYGSLFIKVQACRKSEPLDKPESAAFVQAWEVPVNSDKSEWIFSGWMFASSPALSAMDHPVYDVWVLDCLDKTETRSKSSEGTQKLLESSGDANQGELEKAKTVPQKEESTTEASEISLEESVDNTQVIDNSIESVIDRAQDED